MTLQSSRRRTVGLLLLSLVFAGAGVLMVGADADFGSLAAGFGIVGVVVFTVVLLRPNRLELSEEGLTTVTLGRRWTAKWSECGEFRASTPDLGLGTPSMVLFQCTKAGVGARVLDAAAEALAGTNAALPETYGMPATELAALLNDYREGRRGSGAA